MDAWDHLGQEQAVARLAIPVILPGRGGVCIGVGTDAVLWPPYMVETRSKPP